MTAESGSQRRPGVRLDWRQQCGKVNWHGLIALLLVGSGIYAGAKVIPVRARAYQFADAVRDEVIAAGSRRRSTDDDIRRNLIDRAQELSLPVDRSRIVITRPGRKWVKVQVNYTIDIEFIGGYVYSWNFRHEAEGPLIFAG